MKSNSNSYSVKANDFQFDFTEDEIISSDLSTKHAGEYNLLLNHSSVNAKVIHADKTAKKQTVEVNGEIFEIEIKDELDQVLEKMGFNAVSNKQIKEIKAPMPGLVLDIAVEEGQQVVKGDKILILEAMKMENSIVIPTDATIKTIIVKPGQSVEKGQVLVELL